MSVHLPANGGFFCGQNLIKTSAQLLFRFLRDQLLNCLQQIPKSLVYWSMLIPLDLSLVQDFFRNQTFFWKKPTW